MGDRRLKKLVLRLRKLREANKREKKEKYDKENINIAKIKMADIMENKNEK